MKLHTLTAGTIHEGDWLQADLAPGYTLAILDGPYALGMADWDRQAAGTLADWYAPHLARVSALCAKSASLYFWGNEPGWAEVHPSIVASGWTFRNLIQWDKGIGMIAGNINTETMRGWPIVSEVCGFYMREAWAPTTCAGSEIANAAGADERNWIRPWLGSEWSEAGLRRSQADEALGTNGMAGHYFGASQWSLPTWENYQKLADYANARGTPRDRPYLVHPSVWPGGDLRASYDHLRASYDHLRASYDHLRASYDHLRAEYEASRPAFSLPTGVTNVWATPQVSGSERLKGPDGRALHPCQKPLLFAERMIRASTRPGERVLVPFGGTCREAVVCEWLARSEPEQARRYDVCELNQDPGRDYVAAALAQINGEDPRQKAAGQEPLFRRGVAA